MVMGENTPISILVVEDNRLIAFSLKNELELMGFTVNTAHSVEEAINQVKKIQPNLILMDVNLNEDRDGVDVMKQIHDEVGFIPNIYLSGYAYDELKERAQDTSPMAIFDKPVNTKQLVNVIRKLESV
jgi:CheY-like chemotaxis protein